MTIDFCSLVEIIVVVYGRIIDCCEEAKIEVELVVKRADIMMMRLLLDYPPKTVA